MTPDKLASLAREYLATAVPHGDPVEIASFVHWYYLRTGVDREWGEVLDDIERQ